MGLIVALSLTAIGISTFLAWSSWQAGSIAGCSGDGLIDCDHVLSSRWSSWLGLPVGLLGMLTYVGILAVCWPAAKQPFGLAGTMLLTLSLLAAGAAIWFIAIQAIILQSFCIYCLGVHSCGILIAVVTLLLISVSGRQIDYGQMSSLLGEALPTTAIQPGSRLGGFHPLIATASACLGLAVLMGGQLLYAPKTFGVESPVPPVEIESKVPEEEEAEDLFLDSIVDDAEESEELVLEEQEPEVEEQGADIFEESASRRIQHKGLQEAIDLSEYPMVGSPEAAHVFVELMDYTCDHCRHLHPYLIASLDRYGDQIALVIHHVPLSSRCNPNILQDQPGKKNACDYAKLAIGVWKLAPEEFPGFHEWLMESEKPPSILEARRRAISLAGEGVLIDDSVLEDVNKRIVEQCGVFKQLKGGLPTLLTERGIVRGIPADEKEWFRFLEEGFAVEPIDSNTNNQEESPVGSQSIAEELGF